MASVYAWLYGRVSEEDRRGGHEGTSVPGQMEHLRSLAAVRNWSVVREVAEPKPISASEYTIKTREGYNRLLRYIPADIARIRRTDPDARFVLAAREDTRLSRRPIEREQLMDLCRQTGCWLNFAGTDYDPANPDARLTLRVTGATAAHTSDMTSYKVSTQVANRAAEGRPHGKMPAIYRRRCDETTGKTIEWLLDPEKAAACLEAITSILECRSGPDGHSVKAAADYYNRATDSKMATQQFRRMILLPTLAGIRMFNGKEVGRGNWPALISPIQHRMLVEILGDPGRLTSTRGTEPRYELSYIVKCGLCGSNAMVPSFRKTRTRNHRMYKCSSCNRIGVVAEPLEQLVRAAMFALLADERVVAAMNEKSDDEYAMSLRYKLSAIKDRLNDLYDEAAAGRISAQGIARMEAQLLPQVDDLESRIAALPVGGSILRNYVGTDAPALWETWPVEVRRALIRAALVVTVLPTTPGKRFSPDRVDICWRV